MRGDDRPCKELSIDIYSNTHLRTRETLPVSGINLHRVGSESVGRFPHWCPRHEAW